ncbi:MAG: LiaF transmembrane domain-containing protein [Flavisolibacter sp.]
MTDEQFKNEIRERWGGDPHQRARGRVWTGFFILVLGVLLLLKTANILLFPYWFFTWPVLMIAIGLFSGIRHGFRGAVWLMFIIIGGLSLVDNIDPTLHMDRFNWPIIFIAIGLVFIFRPHKNRWGGWRRRMQQGNWGQQGPLTENSSDSGEFTSDRRDFVDITSVFGGVKKNILTKTFKGGDLVCFMGGAELNLTQADFSGTVRIDTTNIFGGTKLIVPSSWDVQSDVTAIFGGVDDKRQLVGVNLDPNKILILDGTCMFGGIEIRSF